MYYTSFYISIKSKKYFKLEIFTRLNMFILLNLYVFIVLSTFNAFSVIVQGFYFSFRSKQAGYASVKRKPANNVVLYDTCHIINRQYAVYTSQ